MKNQQIQIETVLRQTAMGYTKPFICQCSDGNSYIVKTSATVPFKQLIAEFLGANIAQKMGLPIPHFAILYPLKSATNLLDVRERSNFSFAPAFGSHFIENTSIARFEQAHQFLTEKQQKTLYFFDRWISNSDRNASQLGTGNINLLHTNENKIFVIDHNLAFDFNENKLDFSEHIFSEKHRNWEYTQEDFQFLFKLANSTLKEFNNLVNDIPEEWSQEEWFDEYIQQIYQFLSRINHQQFWEQL